jgi:molybdopterin converting factor small subunit
MKESKKEYQKRYEELNKEKIKKYHKDRYDKQDVEIKKEYAKKHNALKTKEYIDKYNKKQIESGYRKEWHKNQYKNNIQYKLSSILRSRFFTALKCKTKKIDSILNIVGCTIEELKQHIESQFKPEMTWENHGKIWEIDHIKACVNFNLTKLEEQKQCFHYTNLRPLFKTTKIAEQYGYTNEIGNKNKNKY